MKFSSLFYSGRYQELLLTYLKPNDILPASFQERSLTVGALTFQGRLTEAQVIFDRTWGKSNRASTAEISSEVEARFFLGIGFCRYGRYSDSQAHLLHNLAQLRHLKAPRSRFYAWQGIAFFRYFQGRFGLAKRYAERALAEITEVRFAYGRALALDLLGHSETQLGMADKGLATLELARLQASLKGHEGMAEAIKISCLIYQAEFCHLPGPVPISSLQRALLELSPQNVYSRAALLLELANQLTLYGKLFEAKAVLDQAAGLIYGTRHHRHAILLQLRYAHLSYLNGQPYLALSILQPVRSLLDSKMDGLLESKVLGLLHKIVSSVRPDEKAELEQLRARLLLLQGQYPTAVGQKILEREGIYQEGSSRSAGARSLPFAHTDTDKTGEALTLLEKRILHPTPRSLLSMTVRHRMYFRIPQLVGAPAASQLLLFDRTSENLWVLDQGAVYDAGPVSQQLSKLAWALREGLCSKEALVQEIWGHQRYHPLRHDPALYQTVGRFRALLGVRSHWLEASEGGYQLSYGTQVRFLDQDTHSLRKRRELRHVSRIIPLLKSPLNFRQLAILSELRDGEWLSVSDYMKRFKVSDMTARRDIGPLERNGKFRRAGKARATRYLFIGDQI